MSSSAIDPSELQSYRPSVFETLDYIPMISTISGMVRGIFGTLECVFGVIALPIQLAYRVCTREHQPLILIDGIGNCVRGSIATSPIIGNVCLYLYDHAVITKQDFRRAAGLPQ